MQDLVDKLQSKVKSYKRQYEEAVSAPGPGLRARCWAGRLWDPNFSAAPGSGAQGDTSSSAPHSIPGPWLPCCWLCAGAVSLLSQWEEFLTALMARDETQLSLKRPSCFPLRGHVWHMGTPSFLLRVPVGADDQEKPAPFWGWSGNQTDHLSYQGVTGLLVPPGAAGQHEPGQVPQGPARAG